MTTREDAPVSRLSSTFVTRLFSRYLARSPLASRSIAVGRHESRELGHVTAAADHVESRPLEEARQALAKEDVVIGQHDARPHLRSCCIACGYRDGYPLASSR